MVKRILIQWLFRLLDSAMRITYVSIDEREAKRWLYNSFGDKGWESYFKYEDLRILKSLANGQEEKQYWLLVGRRLQLLYLYDEMRKAFELKKSEEEKANVKKE